MILHSNEIRTQIARNHLRQVQRRAQGDYLGSSERYRGQYTDHATNCTPVAPIKPALYEALWPGRQAHTHSSVGICHVHQVLQRALKSGHWLGEWPDPVVAAWIQDAAFHESPRHNNRACYQGNKKLTVSVCRPCPVSEPLAKQLRKKDSASFGLTGQPQWDNFWLANRSLTGHGRSFTVGKLTEYAAL